MLKAGDVIKTSLSESTVVLEVDSKHDTAILLADKDFILAHNMTKNDDGSYSFLAGQYEKSLKNIFDLKNQTNPVSKYKLNESELDINQMKEQILSLMNNNYRSFVKALISIEKQIEDPEILEHAYESYMDKDPVELINPKLFNSPEEKMEYQEPDINDFFSNTSMKI